MKSVDRYLCPDCSKMIFDACLVIKKVPNTEGEQDRCAWCRRARTGARYRIKFEGVLKHG